MYGHLMAIRKLRDEIADLRTEQTEMRKDIRNIATNMAAFRRAAGFEPPHAGDPATAHRAYAWKRTAQALIAMGAIDVIADLYRAVAQALH